jgi:hypothetical protein
MSYDGYVEYNGVELVNLSRTAQLAEALGIDVVWASPDSVQWIQDDLGGTFYNDITLAPWYDAGYPASSEFAGIVPLSINGLDDSTLESTPVEYITDGGHSGKPRNATLPLVWNVTIVASTDRGAEYGKRWLDRTLKDNGLAVFCSGADLRYFRYASSGAPLVHRRDTRLTRGTSVTRKRRTDCSVTWIVTFTMTAADPFEYGEAVDQFTELGGSVTGDGVSDSGSLVLVQQDCPVYDYTPLYDPEYPALVPSPTAPDFYPAGWDIGPGDTFERFWVDLLPSEPTDLNVVPIITLTTTVEARMVRVSFWPSTSDTTDQCDPLFSAVVSYLPADLSFTIDGEQQASYVWDGFSPVVRRADSLVYSPNAEPVGWTAFNDPTGLTVTLDVFAESTGYEGDGFVRAAVALVPKSD